MRKRMDTWRGRIVLLTAAVAAVATLGGCVAAEKFRAAAGSSLQTGVNALADGLIDGVFAVFEPDTTSDAS